MPLLPYVDPQDADERTRALLAGDAEDYGRASLFARVMAHDPDVLDARQAYTRRLVDEGDVDRRTVELVYLAVSVTNDCEYCIASHREALVERVGVPAADVEALARGDREPFDACERAAAAFAEQVARDPTRVDEGHLDELREAGFDDAGVVRLVTVASAAVAANAFADAMGIHLADRDELFS